jgi:hypothetical protein
MPDGFSARYQRNLYDGIGSKWAHRANLSGTAEEKAFVSGFSLRQKPFFILFFPERRNFYAEEYPAQTVSQ